jgi:hypothetical protein
MRYQSKCQERWRERCTGEMYLSSRKVNLAKIVYLFRIRDGVWWEKMKGE